MQTITKVYETLTRRAAQLVIWKLLVFQLRISAFWPTKRPVKVTMMLIRRLKLVPVQVWVRSSVVPQACWQDLDFWRFLDWDQLWPQVGLQPRRWARLPAAQQAVLWVH